MTSKPRKRLGQMLVQSLEQAVAIQRGQLQPARRRQVSSAVAVSAPPVYGASRVRRIRDHLGLSQPVFAKALNVSVGTVRAWEQGSRVPDGPSRRLLEVVERDPRTILVAVQGWP